MDGRNFQAGATLQPEPQGPYNYPISHVNTSDANMTSRDNSHTGSTPLPATPVTPYAPVAPYGPQPDGSEVEEQKGLRPFLSMGGRMWLTAFNPALLPLIFTIVHLAQTRSSTNDLAASLKDSVLKACQSLAKGAGSLQTLPRYLAMQTNEQVLKATRATVLGTGLALMLCVQVIEAVVNFIIDTYRSLLLCTIQLVVQGSLEILIAAVQEISDAVTNALNAIRTNIQDDIASMNNLIQKAADGVASVLSRIGIDFSIPEISIPSLSWLQNVTIPNGFENSLIKLNHSLPNLDELREKMNSIVDMPLELLIKEINTTRLEIAATLNDSIYPVPSLSSLSDNNTKSLQDQLCSDMDTSLIDDTAKALYNLGTVAIWGMVVAVLVAWAVLAFWQWRRWKALKDTVEVVESEMVAQQAQQRRYNPWTVVAVVEHPVLERYSRPVFNKLDLAPRTRNNVRWFLSYLGHPTCLTLLFMAVVGFISIQAQIAALHALQAKAKADATQSLNASTADFAGRLNAISANASRQYAIDMNNAIQSLENRINNEMFGEWINGTAVTLNNTLVEFYSEVQSLLDTAFGNTILYNPINTFVYCIVGSKIDALEKGLTWVSTHAHVTLPTVPEDVLLLSPESSKELAAPLADAAVGGDDGDGGAVGKLVAHFEKALKAEQMLYATLLAVYGLVFCAGLAVVIWHSGGKERYAKWQATRGGGNGGRDTNPAVVQAYPFGNIASTTPPRESPRWRNVPLYAMFRRSNSHKDVPASPKVDPEKGWHEKAWHEKTPAISQESIASLAAPGQAYLRMHAATPDVGAPLPPLPTYQATGPPIQDRWGLHIQDIDDPVSRQFGTPQPEQRRTLVIVNRSSLSDLSTPPGSNRETMLEVQTTPRRVPLPILPDYLPTPTKTSIDSTSSASGSLDRPGGSTPPSAPFPASSKTSLRDLLLPAIERRKRAMEDRINPFVDERGDAAEVLNTPAPTPRKNDTGMTKSQNTNPSQSRNPFYDVSFDSDIVDEFPSPPRLTAQSNRNPFSDQNPFVAAAEAAGVGPPPVNPFAQRCGRV